MNTQFENHPPRPTDSLNCISTTLLDGLYAISNHNYSSNSLETPTYNMIKVVAVKGSKIKVCQYGREFHRLPTFTDSFVDEDQLGAVMAQFWLNKGDFLSWRPVRVSLNTNLDNLYNFDELDWVA